jgi:uncharacterized paraquat-inducible protein A
MPRTRDEPEDDEDDGDDYDVERDYDPDDPETYPEGLYVDNERAVIPCPHCRAEIDEESEQCPRCGMYLSKEDAPGGKSPVWIIVMALALLAALALALAG